MTRKIFALLPLLLIGMLAMAQTGSDQKLTKAEKKALREEKREANLKKILKVVEAKEFVVEAHTFIDRRGLSIPINPTLNFVAIEEDEGIIQLAFGNGPGLNGLGGITTDGKVLKYEITEKKKGIALTVRLFGSAFGATDILLDINASGNTSVKVITLNGGRFTFNGTITGIEQSSVFQGTTIY